MRSLEGSQVPADVGEPRADTPGPIAAWAYPASLVLWASSWHLRNSVLFAWSPIEPTYLAAGAVAVCVLHRLGQRRGVAAGAWLPVLLLVVAFAPGAIRTSAEGYGPTKLAAMAFVTLPILVAAILLLDTRAAKARWLWMQAVMSATVAAAALRFSDPAALLSTGRLTLDTVDTISTARLVAVGAVVLILLGLTAMRRLWWALVPGVFLAVVALQVGSRGPVLFLVLALAVSLGFARQYAGRRLLPLGVLAVLLVAAFDFLASGGAGSGGARVLESSKEGFSDIARTELLQSAVQIGYVHPGGIGWGDFAEHSKIGGELANEQGNAYAHNVLAEAFAEGGLIALFALAGVIGLALWRLYRSSADPMMAILLGSVVFWVLNALVSSDLVGNRFMWLSLACGLTAYTVPARHAPPAGATSSAPAPE